MTQSDGLVRRELHEGAWTESFERLERLLNQ
jgi:hypothetical protein